MSMPARERVLPRPQLATQVALATIFAALTALGARVQVHLPFTPVPITGQTFCVLLAGGVLGPRLGFLSQLEYLAAGVAGLPVFAHGGGLLALIGPTSGYLVAFPLAALVTGLITERVRTRGARVIGGLLGVVAIYALGAAWYAVWATAVGKVAGLTGVLAQSVYPFVAVDAVKAILAAGAAGPLKRRLE